MPALWEKHMLNKGPRFPSWWSCYVHDFIPVLLEIISVIVGAAFPVGLVSILCLWRASILLSSRHLLLACSWIGWLFSYWLGNDSCQHADSQKRAHLAGVQSAEIQLPLALLCSHLKRMIIMVPLYPDVHTNVGTHQIFTILKGFIPVSGHYSRANASHRWHRERHICMW